MNKLLTITVLIAFLALGTYTQLDYYYVPIADNSVKWQWNIGQTFPPPAGAESFRVPRQAEEEEKGTIATVVGSLKSYYDQSVGTASSYLESIKGYKLEEKAK